MSTKRLRLIVSASLVLAVVLAAWFLPRKPLVAVPLLALVAGVAVLQLTALSARKKLVQAALRCDLAALEALALRGGVLLRVEASFTLFHHGGFHHAAPSLCTCGECPRDVTEQELDLTRRITRLAWEGRGDEAAELSYAQSVVAEGPLGELTTKFRLVNRFLAVALAPGEDEHRAEDAEWFDTTLEGVIEPHIPCVLWPARLAAAIAAMRRGDAAAARKRLAGMPSWAEGSPLEERRRELVARLRD